MEGDINLHRNLNGSGWLSLLWCTIPRLVTGLLLAEECLVQDNSSERQEAGGLVTTASSGSWT